MARYLLMLMVCFTFNAYAAITPNVDTSRPTATALSVDYVLSDNALYGITLAPYHYDPNYQDWGYYLGYAVSKQTDIPVEAPSESYHQDALWRAGVSYSFTNDLSFYIGASVLINATHFTNNISPRTVDGKPTWEVDKDKRWGGDIGLRYRLGKNLILGAGYNSSTQSALLSIGYVN